MLFSYLSLTSAPSANNGEKRSTEVAANITQTNPAAESSQLNNTSGTAQDSVVLTASGYVVAKKIAKVSSEVTGRVTEILVEEGERVDAGQIIAKLDDEQAQVNRKLAEANVEIAKLQVSSTTETLKESERLLSRNKGLFDSDFLTEEHIVDLQTRATVLKIELEQAVARFEVAQLELQRQELNLEDTVIVSPLSGVVVEKTVQIGEIVSPILGNGGFNQSGIITLIDMNSLEIEVDVNESYIGRVAENHLVTASLDAYPEWELKGSVIAIVPTANRSKATVKVRIRIHELQQLVDNEGQQILPEMGVKVKFLR